MLALLFKLSSDMASYRSPVGSLLTSLGGLAALGAGGEGVLGLVAVTLDDSSLLALGEEALFPLVPPEPLSSFSLLA